ncbi:hypothetical protein GGX14DRAFT_352366 [Mycena pura]|uniref:C3H1-type domain-containing protein n=1 Tax=Mycena pura TaxID=153505 RepID=A0AAD7E0M4_9AGAR|nr:hypothetical protein GGX14DRAFT_352366 [Mycena pura]
MDGAETPDRDEAQGNKGPGGEQGEKPTGENDSGEQDDGGELRSRKRTFTGHSGDATDSGSKRPKVDASEYAWRARAEDFLETLHFTPEHQRVLEQVEIHSRDIKGAVTDVTIAPFVPALPYGQWKPILLDQFVDFDSILSNTFATEPEEPQQLVIGETSLEVKKSKVVSKITTHGQWINAFRVYEDAVNFAFDGRRHELRTYWTHINDLFSSRHYSLHSRVISYDRATRVFVGQRRDVLLGDVHRFRHIQDAHLSDGGIAIVTPKPRDRNGKPSRANNGTETCRKWNFGRCQLGVDCRYRHVCLGCGNTGHRKSDCSEKQRQ